jgi:hypothetical protein
MLGVDGYEFGEVDCHHFIRIVDSFSEDVSINCSTCYCHHNDPFRIHIISYSPIQRQQSASGSGQHPLPFTLQPRRARHVPYASQECLPSAGILASLVLKNIEAKLGSVLIDTVSSDEQQFAPPLPFSVTAGSVVLSVSRVNAIRPMCANTGQNLTPVQVPFVDLRDRDCLKFSEFDALVVCDLSVSNRCNKDVSSGIEPFIAITSSSITTRYHPTRLPLLYQFFKSLVPANSTLSPPSSSPAAPPRIVLKVAQVLSIWARGGGGGTGALVEESAPPPEDAYGTCIKGEICVELVSLTIMLVFVFVFIVLCVCYFLLS